MTRSFLATIRDAVMSGPEIISSDEDQPGANALNANAQDGQTQEIDGMVDTPKEPGANAGTITQANHDSAVSAARAEGEAAGAKASNDRFAAVISAEGVAGNATRMSAAIDLAIKSPGMSATDITTFVSANVAAAPAPAPAQSPASLAARGAAAATDPLAGSDQPAAAANAKAGWDSAFGKTNAH